MKEAGIEPVMITGDNWRTAHAVAAQADIALVLAEVLPDQKAARVREFQQQGYRVAMVGDGINDAPALMQADVGIAIGAGTDIAIESADIVLIGDRLSGVVDAYYIGKSSFRKTVQNVTLAFAFNGIGVPLAVTGLVHPVMAMVAMAASVSVVLLNSFGGKLIPGARRKASETLEDLTVKVPTIHCEGCVETIREVLTRRGALKVTGDARAKSVSVRYPKEILDEEAIREEIVRAGFVVEDPAHTDV
jgi:cation transport ATPase